MAEVFQVRALPTTWRSAEEPEEVVIKRLMKRFRHDESFIRQFVNEANITRELRHPNIVRTFHYFQDGDDHLMVQELVLGRTLEWVVGEYAKNASGLPPEMAVAIACSVLRALHYVHSVKFGSSTANIIHRDVSPANVLLSLQGEVKLFDFGVAEVDDLLRDANVKPIVPLRAERGALRGTLAYMSPEAVMGHSVDARTDLFGVGVILFEMLTGQKLFAADSEFEVMRRVRACEVPPLHSINSSLHPMLQVVLDKALAPESAQRFQTAQQFLKQLEIVASISGWPIGAAALKPLLG
jgi:eukaryotic-like serine/threonine-protein kinase